MENCLSPNELVEVINVVEGFRGSCSRARVVETSMLDPDNCTVIVEYVHFVDESGTKLREQVPMSENRIVPLPPNPPANFTKFLRVGTSVEAWVEDCWWGATLISHSSPQRVSTRKNDSWVVLIHSSGNSYTLDARDLRPPSRPADSLSSSLHSDPQEIVTGGVVEVRSSDDCFHSGSLTVGVVRDIEQNRYLIEHPQFRLEW